MSNLAGRLTTRGTNERILKLDQGVGKGLRDLLFKFWHPSVSQERSALEASHFQCQCIMTIPVTISGSNRNRKYNSSMADVRFLKSEVVITQAWTGLSCRSLVLR